LWLDCLRQQLVMIRACLIVLTRSELRPSRQAIAAGMEAEQTVHDPTEIF